MPKTTGFGSMSDKNTCEGVDDSYSLRLQTGRCLSSGLKNWEASVQVCKSWLFSFGFYKFDVYLDNA